jgi:hypothetical protein
MANVGLLGSGTVKNNFSYGGTLRKQGFEVIGHNRMGDNIGIEATLPDACLQDIPNGQPLI